MKKKLIIHKLKYLLIISLIISLIIACKNGQFSEQENTSLKKISHSDSTYVKFNAKNIKAYIFNSDISTNQERLFYTPLIGIELSDILITKINMINMNYLIYIYFVDLDKTQKFEYTLEYLDKIKKEQKVLQSLLEIIDEKGFNYKEYFKNESDYIKFKKVFCNENYKKEINIYGVKKDTRGNNKLLYLLNDNKIKSAIIFNSNNIIEFVGDDTSTTPQLPHE